MNSGWWQWVLHSRIIAHKGQQKLGLVTSRTIWASVRLDFAFTYLKSVIKYKRKWKSTYWPPVNKVSLHCDIIWHVPEISTRFCIPILLKIMCDKSMVVMIKLDHGIIMRIVVSGDIPRDLLLGVHIWISYLFLIPTIFLITSCRQFQTAFEISAYFYQNICTACSTALWLGSTATQYLYI